MELTTSRSVGPSLPRRIAARVDLPAVAAWTLAFAVVAYLALCNGGYDTIVRSQVGIAVWWIVLLGALAGVLPMRFGRAGWAAIGLLGGFALWTGLATGWSESADRTSIEFGRVAMYLGVLVLAIVLQGCAAARNTINGLACAIGGVTCLAVLSRLHPGWFRRVSTSSSLAAAFRGDVRRRLMTDIPTHSRPKRLRTLITAYASGGAALLLVGALSAGGVGPLGA